MVSAMRRRHLQACMEEVGGREEVERARMAVHVAIDAQL